MEGQNPDKVSASLVASRDKDKERKREWYEANRDREREKRREYYAANGKKARTYREANREEANREAIREKKREYDRARREANREKILAEKRAYHAANREKIRAYRKANPEKIRAQMRAWREANPEKRRDNESKRRAAKKGAVVERVSRREVFERDGWRCGICGSLTSKNAKPSDPKAPTVDHIVPLSKGGNHSMKNVQCAHFGCNAAKGNRSCGSQLRLIG